MKCAEVFTEPFWIGFALGGITSMTVLALVLRPLVVRKKSGTIVMPEVKLPEGYEPPSAAVK